MRSLEESSSSSQILVLQLYLYMQQASSDDKPSPALSKDLLKSLLVTTLEGEATAITMVRKLAMDPKPGCGIAKVEGQELKEVVVSSDGFADLQPLASWPDWLPALRGLPLERTSLVDLLLHLQLPRHRHIVIQILHFVSMLLEDFVSNCPGNSTEQLDLPLLAAGQRGSIKQKVKLIGRMQSIGGVHCFLHKRFRSV